MRHILIALVFAYSMAQAQTTVESLAAEIERSASQEVPALGAATRLQAATRVRFHHPDMATRLLERALEAAQQGTTPYLTYRLLQLYAGVDSDAAYKKGKSIANPEWFYSAMIDAALRKYELDSAEKLALEAVSSGQHVISAVNSVVQRLRALDKDRAAALLQRVVNEFPEETASPREVCALFQRIAEFPNAPPRLVYAALAKAFAAYGRPDFASETGLHTLTAKFQIKGVEVETRNSGDTALLIAAAYLAAYDPIGWFQRRGSLPDWKEHLVGLRPADMSNIVRTARPLYKFREPPPATAKYPDYSKMPLEDALRAVSELPDSQRGFFSQHILFRDDCPPECREQLMPRIAADIRLLTPRFETAKGFYARVRKANQPNLVQQALEVLWDAVEAAPTSGDRRDEGDFDRGSIQQALDSILDDIEQGQIQPDRDRPSLESRRLLRQLDKAILSRINFELKMPDGTTWRLADYKGKVVLIDFWASWCAPCIEALPALNKLTREFQQKNVFIVGIADESTETIRSSTDRWKLEYPTLADSSRSVHDLFGVEGIPATFVIDRAGNVDRLPFPHTEQLFRDAIRRAMAEAP